MADAPILDAHVHQWDPKGTPREVTTAVKLLGWSPRLLETVVRAAIPKPLIDFVGKADHALNNYLPENLRHDCGEHASRHEGVVHVQAGWKAKSHRDLVDETSWLESIDPTGGTIRAIVGAAHLDATDLPEVLDAHEATSPRFRGIRDMLSAHPDDAIVDFARSPDLMRNEAWRAGYGLLGERGLSFDAWMYHHQLDEFITLAQEYPDTSFVLCHLATPVAMAGEFGGRGVDAKERERIEEEWKAALTRIAAVPHGRFKISGMLMPIVGFGAERREHPMTKSEFIDRLGPFLTWTLDTLGIERCMFGSNFPMDKVSIDWATLVSGYDELLADRSDDQRRRFWAETARSFYRIER
ncbi:MAG: amidohydrolase family protein [Acidimicrobiales bacterium]|nr:amidohydrolase family protein [Acidimicrobiales bacterium]